MGVLGKNGTVTRRLLLGGALGFFAGHSFAGAPVSSLRPLPRGQNSLPRKPQGLKELVSNAGFTGKSSVVIADAKTGKILEAHNPILSLPPASVTKVITALYALDRLGADYRFQTSLIATGPIANGRLNGNLILAGGGDPVLNTDALGDMARRLKAAGIREISGKFLVYGGALPNVAEIDKSQPDHVSYNPAISGINLNYNRVHFEWKRQSGSYSLTMEARARKFRPVVSIATMRAVDRELPVYTYTSKVGRDQWTVARRALGNGGSRWLPVRKPELYAAEVFQTIARSFGIVLPKPKVTKSIGTGKAIVVHNSPTLANILQGMLKYSTNLTAEVVGLTASARTGKPTSLKSSAKEMTNWARSNLGISKANFVDHSGLGAASKISAREMVEALVVSKNARALQAILKNIPVRNINGEIIENHPAKVRAKTGTLNYVSALAGYEKDASGRELAFAIFSADVPRRNKIKASDGEVPPGTRTWRGRARRMQNNLLRRWGSSFGS